MPDGAAAGNVHGLHRVKGQRRSHDKLHVDNSIIVAGTSPHKMQCRCVKCIERIGTNGHGCTDTRRIVWGVVTESVHARKERMKLSAYCLVGLCAHGFTQVRPNNAPISATGSDNVKNRLYIVARDRTHKGLQAHTGYSVLVLVRV